MLLENIRNLFKDQELFNNFRDEIIKKFKSQNIKGFKIEIYHKYSFLKDDFPLCLTIQVPFHPQIDIKNLLPKEVTFLCFKNTILENKSFYIKGETII